MRILIWASFLFLGCSSPSTFLSEDQVKLSPPLLASDEVFFNEKLLFSIPDGEQHTKTYYSNNRETWSIYTTPLSIEQTSQLSFFQGGGSYINSDTIQMSFYKLPIQKSKIIEESRNAHEMYPGKGLATLADQNKGSFDFRSKEWKGYEGGEVTFSFQFDKKEVRKIVISTLVDQASWIFEPHLVRIYSEGKLLKEKVIADCNLRSEKCFGFIEIEIPNIEIETLDIKIETMSKIPSWHVGKENKPWLFIDEILIY